MDYGAAAAAGERVGVGPEGGAAIESLQNYATQPPYLCCSHVATLGHPFNLLQAALSLNQNITVGRYY